MPLSSKHKRTLKEIFDDPVRSDITWTRIESMLVGLDAEISEGRGSRIRVALNGIRMVFHRPHPKKETDKGAVKSIQRFLKTAGVQP
ncbi:MAG: type II toxin-antitoxin system HicA family toxin [Deltaproteobacteria bacterium]|nr:type II toxin-antitoxin system HicA family toxin [Deltaproteobacteria bacterium]MBT7888484.1 type II toxin-antitoxin system HicA family toxin [Deltaproteobacteria bacterium]